MMLGMVLVWGTVIVLAVWGVSSLFPRLRRPAAFLDDRALSAREILEARYARGELTQEEFKRMAEDLHPPAG